jgi:predicted Zn-dependent protease with MMP-like domain
MTLARSKPEFERLVAAALRGMPARFRRFLDKENVVVVVERRPTRAKLLSMGMNPDRETLFGLYEGVPRTQRPSNYNMALPDKITIYQEPLEDEYPGQAALKEQVRRTVLHEVAHFFGIDDDELDRIGWH